MKKENPLKWIKEQSKFLKKTFKPTIDYDKEYDILFISFTGHGKLKVDSTAETTTEQGLPIRFDFTKNCLIVGVEIENASKIWETTNDKLRKDKRKLEKSIRSIGRTLDEN